MKRIASIAAALLAASMMSLTAFAERLPEPYGQNKNHWCWAAAIKMVVEHNSELAYSSDPEIPDDKNGLHSYDGKPYYGEDSNGNITVDGAQRSIVLSVHYNDKDDIGTLDDMYMGLIYASTQPVVVGQVGRIGYKLSDYAIESLKFELKKGEYVLAGCYDAAYLYGHVDVITKYNAATDTFTVFDPWDKGWKYPTSAQLFDSYGFYTAGHFERLEYYFYCNTTANR